MCEGEGDYLFFTVTPNVFEAAFFNSKNTAILFEHTVRITYCSEINRDDLQSLLHTPVHKEEIAIITKG
jgi:hypothetical protein